LYDLSNLTTSDISHCARELRDIGIHACSLEDVAQEIAQYLYENMTTGKGEEKAIALSRVFLVIPYKDLLPDLKSFANKLLKNEKVNPHMMCLTLLGTKGEKEDWNSRETSVGHKAIPLASENFVRNIPMISGLINQMGLELKDVLSDSIYYDECKTFNVFHVPLAINNPLLPAQDFVASSNIKSVLGFGGVLQSGRLFSTIIFTKIPISREIASLFRLLSLNVRSALMPYDLKIFRP
jgi:hypothetical protein